MKKLYLCSIFFDDISVSYSFSLFLPNETLHPDADFTFAVTKKIFDRGALPGRVDRNNPYRQLIVFLNEHRAYKMTLFLQNDRTRARKAFTCSRRKGGDQQIAVNDVSPELRPLSKLLVDMNGVVISSQPGELTYILPGVLFIALKGIALIKCRIVHHVRLLIIF